MKQSDLPLGSDEPELIVAQHTSASYGPRTKVNADLADLTVAFAADFSTAGERLTRKVSGNRYVGVPLDDDPITAARRVYRALRDLDAHTINVAGNGAYTLSEHMWDQETVDAHLYRVFSKLNEHWPIHHIRSGGQTGVDLAGLRVAVALQVSATGLLPKGFRQRGVDRRDYTSTEDQVREQIMRGARVLNPRV